MHLSVIPLKQTAIADLHKHVHICN